jgi:hypothetical protein
MTKELNSEETARLETIVESFGSMNLKEKIEFFKGNYAGEKVDESEYFTRESYQFIGNEGELFSMDYICSKSSRTPEMSHRYELKKDGPGYFVTEFTPSKLNIGEILEVDGSERAVLINDYQPPRHSGEGWQKKFHAGEYLFATINRSQLTLN